MISVIIPIWLTPDQHGKYGKHEVFWMAYETVRRLKRVTDADLEIVLVDNGSTLTDDDLRRDKEQFAGKGRFGLWGQGIPLVSSLWEMADKVVHLHKNLGYGPGCNAGYRQATGEYVVMGNDDLLVYPGWEKALIDALEDKSLDPPVGVVMPALMKETKDFNKALEWGIPDLTKNFNSIGKGAEFGSYWMARKDFLDVIVKKNGGCLFDEGFMNGKEDRWLWQQVRMEGFETYRTHKTRVFHQGTASTGKFKERGEYRDKNTERLEELKKKHGLS